MGRKPLARRYFQRTVALGDIPHYYYRTIPGGITLEVSFGPLSNWYPSYLSLTTILDRLRVVEIIEEQCPSRDNGTGFIIDLSGGGVHHGT